MALSGWTGEEARSQEEFIPSLLREVTQRRNWSCPLEIFFAAGSMTWQTRAGRKIILSLSNSIVSGDILRKQPGVTWSRRVCWRMMLNQLNELLPAFAGGQAGPQIAGRYTVRPGQVNVKPTGLCRPGLLKACGLYRYLPAPPGFRHLPPD
ncbi:hypothetical protein HOY82DRAFT_603609 [Tuber indicum]|nr:hypothetical protein HOY82DRAFT_603609 [Tuber indicum]